MYVTSTNARRLGAAAVAVPYARRLPFAAAAEAAAAAAAAAACFMFCVFQPLPTGRVWTVIPMIFRHYVVSNPFAQLLLHGADGLALSRRCNFGELPPRPTGRHLLQTSRYVVIPAHSVNTRRELRACPRRAAGSHGRAVTLGTESIPSRNPVHTVGLVVSLFS